MVRLPAWGKGSSCRGNLWGSANAALAMRLDCVRELERDVVHRLARHPHEETYITLLLRLESPTE